MALRDTFFMVGDTYAARSKDQGQTWKYYDPDKLWVSAKGVRPGSMRLVKPRLFDMAVWVMAHKAVSESSTNTVRIAVSRGRDKLRTMTWTSIVLPSTALGATNGQSARVHDVSTTDKWLYLSLELP